MKINYSLLLHDSKRFIYICVTFNYKRMQNTIGTLKKLAKTGLIITIETVNDHVCKISVNKSGQIATDMGVLTERKIPAKLEQLAAKVERMAPVSNTNDNGADTSVIG